ncbi:deoxyribodipyrimidine photolyase-related protein [Methylohalomonas lacus]|uniref:Deoxyribodipyrimidine photolyase-related protein n=1 Tax=Methylohalomonas lacus TaxID=398773 RepID=A0AAE3HLC7_9GAMM|nr:deoxyribodipyrimidine photolyase-related protein [Methylohalomonas lacus]
MKTLRFILGDQLSRELASLRDIDAGTDVVLMAEVMDEATYVRHHKKKIAFVFSAMRHFATELQDRGYQVDYRRLDDRQYGKSLRATLVQAVKRHRPDRVVVTEPGEWRLLTDMRDWQSACGRPVEIRDDDRFLCARKQFNDWFDAQKQPRMEYFYRQMRRQTGYLMVADKPAGGRWNFDTENRNPLKDNVELPAIKQFRPDAITADVLTLVDERFADHFGELTPFRFAVTRSQALAVLRHFIANALPRFGDYQDAMLQDERFLFHSILSLYLNIGLLTPREVCDRVENAYQSGHVPLNCAEGFIRQIIGWREYVRGIYFHEMPDYADNNYFSAQGKLPVFYWTGETDMNCLHQVISQTRDEAYAHHIQRLMITGNFAMLAGVAPGEIHDWYLRVYADAYEWVELPNTLGMSQFADGGLLGSKPYAAGGNYINKMSNYCQHCRYKVSAKSGPDACPFNYLYWDFLIRNRDQLEHNRRLAFPYKHLARMSEERIAQIHRDSRRFLQSL